MADLLRRLHRPPLQRADADQPDDGQEPDARLDARGWPAGCRQRGRRVRPRRRRRRWRATSSSAAKGTEEFASAAPSVKGAILQVERHPLRDRARQRLGASTRATAASCGATSGRRKGGTHIGNRGAAMWRNYLFFETPDNYLVSLDARTGKERWHVEIADFNQQYFSTMAPIVVGNHVLVGTGNDLDAPGFLQSYDPETGKRKWIFYTVPMKPGRSRARHLAEPRRRAARRRTGLDPRRLRSGDQALHLRHRQPDARLHRRRPQGRQPLHLLARRGQRRHRQDGVVLPDVAARHARLGLGADADPDRRHDQRQAAQAGVDRVAQRLLLHRRSRDRRARRHRASTARRRTGRRASARTGRPSRIRRRKRRFPARWSRRSKAASSTGSRPRTRRTPACSTRRRTTASRCST